MESNRYAGPKAVHQRRNNPFADSVVDGLLHGMFAGSVMLALLVGMGNLLGKAPPALLSMLGAPDAASSPMQGALRHIAMSAVYGIVWSLLIVLPVRRQRFAHSLNWRLVGVGYGVLLWSIALIVIQYWTALSLLPWYALLIAHMVYGGTLGYLKVRQSLPKPVRS